MDADRGEPEKRPANHNPSRHGARRRLFWSLSAQGFAIAIWVGLQLVLVPVLIHGWGTLLYRDWIVLISAADVLMLLDLGTSVYIGNALLIARSRQDQVAYRHYFAVGMGFYAVVVTIAIITLALLAVFVPWPGFLGVTAMSSSVTYWTCGILALAMLCLLPQGIINAVYRAHGDYGLGFATVSAADILRTFGVCVIVLLGGGPAVAALAYLAVAAVGFAGIILHQKRRYQDLPYGIAAPWTAQARPIFARSTLYLFPLLSNSVGQNIPVILLGTLGTVPAAVVTYAVTRTMVGIIRQTIVQLCHAVGSEIARQHAVEDFDATRLLVASTGRLATGSAGLLGGLVMVAARPLLRRWTGGTVVDDPWLVGVFIATIIATAPAQVAYITFLYANKPAALVASNFAQAVGTVVLCVLLIARWSAIGAAVATGLAEVLAVGIYLPYLLCREISLPLLPYLGRCAAIAATAFVLSLGVAKGCLAILPGDTVTQLGALGLLWAMVMAAPAFFLLFSAPTRAALRVKLLHR